MKKEYRLGVVGYCPPSRFDEEEAKRMIVEAYNQVTEQHRGRAITIVSGLTNVGVLKLAYEEAKKRGWKTVGIACKRAEEHDLFSVDEQQIVGENWGDESETFVNNIDGILKIGGGKQSKHEVEAVIRKGGEAIVYELKLLTEDTRVELEKAIEN